MSKAAGILFVSLNGHALFLHRTATALDCAGCYDFPGGTAENGETAEETAVRETREEIGFLPEGSREIHTRTRSSALKGVAGLGAPAEIVPIAGGAPAVPAPVAPAIAMPPDLDFTTFIQRVTNEFVPELNDEHDGWAWAPIGSPPEPLHPGCRIALDRINMDELGVARAIADGRLTSPQRYENVWLFAIRITGTSVSYRPQAKEFVYRKPENYLTEEFLARCNGLPVIYRHPETALLNSDEFSNRVVGTVFLPYIAGDEVWAVAKIYVDAVAEMMKEGNLSTSPGVNFDDFSVNARLTIDGKTKVLSEGKPSLLDHVAICTLGVWDKGGDPSGIRSESSEDSAMSAEEDRAKKDADEAAAKAAEDKAKKDAAEKEEKEKADKAKADADAGQSLDKKLSHMLDAVTGCVDAVKDMSKRMDVVETSEKERKDAMDKAKKDAEEKGDPEKIAADKAKKDAEEKEEKEKADKAKKDAADKAKTDSVQLSKRIEEVASMIPKAMVDADYHAVVEAQSCADSIFNEFGKRAPIPQQGETVSTYERRVVKMLQEHSPTWKAADISKSYADDASFNIVKGQVFSEAVITARNPAQVTAGQLRMIEKRADGHIIREFVGSPRAWMDNLAGLVKLKATGAWKHENLNG